MQLSFGSINRSSLGRALSIGVLAAVSAAASLAQPTSSGEVVSSSISRGAVNPVTGKAFGYGYYTYFNGIPGPLFSGLPGEKTAYFTFRTGVAETFPLPDNLNQKFVYSMPASYDIYLDTDPNRDWSNPNSFTTGVKVATFFRSEFLGVQVGDTLSEAFTADLIYSRPFRLNGKTYDFKDLALQITTENLFSSQIFPGLNSDFPYFLPFAGHAYATKLPCERIMNTLGLPARTCPPVRVLKDANGNPRPKDAAKELQDDDQQ
jgi:hypothetical protein